MWIQKEILNSLREKKGLYYLGPASSLGGAFKDLWKWLTVTFQTCTDGTSEYNNTAYVFLQSSIRKDSCWQRKKNHTKMIFRISIFRCVKMRFTEPRWISPPSFGVLEYCWWKLPRKALHSRSSKVLNILKSIHPGSDLFQLPKIKPQNKKLKTQLGKRRRGVKYKGTNVRKKQRHH